VSREPTVRRGGSGRMGLVVTLVLLSLAELAIIGVLILLPVLEGVDLEAWRIVLTAVLLTLFSVVFLAVSFVKEDGKLKWRWSK